MEKGKENKIAGAMDFLEALLKQSYNDTKKVSKEEKAEETNSLEKFLKGLLGEEKEKQHLFCYHFKRAPESIQEKEVEAIKKMQEDLETTWIKACGEKTTEEFKKEPTENDMNKIFGTTFENAGPVKTKYQSVEDMYRDKYATTKANTYFDETLKDFGLLVNKPNPDSILISDMEETFKKCLALARKKNKDYGETKKDSYANFRKSESVGVSPERAILVRMSDKLSRMSTLLDSKEPQVKTESFEDTIDDMINYAAILKSYCKNNKK